MATKRKIMFEGEQITIDELSPEEMAKREERDSQIGGKFLSKEETIEMLRKVLKEDPSRRKDMGMALALYPQGDPQKYPNWPESEEQDEQIDVERIDRMIQRMREDPQYDPDLEEYYKLDDGYEPV